MLGACRNLFKRTILRFFLSFKNLQGRFGDKVEIAYKRERELKQKKATNFVVDDEDEEVLANLAQVRLQGEDLGPRRGVLGGPG